MNATDTCIFCEQFVACSGTPAYSDVTPATDPWMFCMKGHWEIEPFEANTEEYREKLATAEACADWEPCEMLKGESGNAQNTHCTGT